MKRRRGFSYSTFNIEHSTFNIWFSFKQHEASGHTGPLAPRLLRHERSSEGNDEDQRGQCADTDPDPFLARQAGGLHLVDVLRELMEVLRRELGQTLFDLLFGEPA